MDVAAVVSLAFVASITPGPNNVMLWASGLNHGVRGTLRHLAGVNLGFTFLLFVVAIGLGAAFERYPALELGLKIAGGAYLLYLAHGLFTTVSTGSDAGVVRPPMTFVQAALFQWVNPKAWVMGVTATSTGLADDKPIIAAALALAGLFGLVNLPCITAWMASGAFASRFLEDEGRLRRANQVLGVLLGLTVVLVVT